MPFGEGFDEIYELFLVPSLVEAGFNVVRADNIKNSQNILKDIVRGIAASDLVVADLTDSNANVYYELGLAHALGSPVILLTQSIDDLPFDLRSYRVIPYKTHFVEITRAREQLTEIASALLQGSVEFGSPASDFLGIRPKNPMWSSPQSSEEGDAGFLDHLARIEEGFERLARFVTEIAEQTTQLTASIRETTEKLTALYSGQTTPSARQAQTLIRVLAQKQNQYSNLLTPINESYTSELNSTRTALEAIVRTQIPRTPQELEQIRRFLELLYSFEGSAKAALANVNAMADSLRAAPSVERSYNRARDRTVAQLERFADNIEQTISMAVRTREIGESKLPQSPPDDH